VLILVVALLGLLFVAGAAFLGTVAFESRSISAVQKAEREAQVIERLSLEVRKALRQGFVGNDGNPWNRDAEATGGSSPIGNDISGEIPGVHPLLASIEPYNDGSEWVFYGVTDLGRCLEDRVVAFDGTYFPRVVASTVLQDRAPPDEDEFVERGSVFDPNEDTDPDDSEYYRRDADGDGVWESYEYLLPTSRYPPAIRGSMGEDLRAADAAGDDLYYALRVIPHGAMVNLKHGHAKLLESLFMDLPGWDTLGRRYAPESEESTMRRRFLVPPRQIPLTSLQARNGEIPHALYEVFFDGGDFENDFMNGDANARWWPIDTGENGDDVVSELVPKWVGWMNPVNPVEDTYDIRHLLTTVGHDDQLMRMGRLSGSLTDWKEDILAAEPDPTPGTPGHTGNYAIDEWPSKKLDDPLRGRLKVSLPGLVDKVLVAQAVDGWFGTGDTFDGTEINALSDSGFNDANPGLTAQFIATIQDAFMLMFKNVRDADGDGAPDEVPDDQDARNRLAAALTANLIDFADSDTNGLPTWVEEVDADGLPLGTFVYGIERQPYITELYSLVDDSGAPPPEFSFAIELYNPYSDLSDPIDLGDYKLWDATGLPHNLADDGVLRLQPAVGLAGSIGGGEFLTVYASLYDSPGADPAIGLGGNWGVDFDSRIQLLRNVPGPGGGNVDIVVDEFDAAAVPGGTLGTKQAGSPYEVSAERDTSETTSGYRWRLVVPKATETAGHTLSNYNSAGSVDPSIRPVHIDFADTGNITAAFPTTGTLLLLSRYANTATTAFNTNLVGTGSPEQQIDNGRMPVFDQSKLAQDPGAPFALSLPWGQLLFEYLTALPLSNQYDAGATFAGGDPETWKSALMPTVDQNGVRVHGRIDLNSAPWPVLEGLPLVPAEAIPSPFRTKIQTLLGLSDTDSTGIGFPLAQSIVAYREARQVEGATHDFGTSRLRSDGGGGPLTGFLSVGELANVRNPLGGGSPVYDIDLGVIGTPADEDFVKAAAVLVALGDWVTTRSHVFTVYGTLRGSGSKSLVDQKALRFQETVDRMPSMFSGSLPRRIGQRTVGSYNDARSD